MQFKEENLEEYRYYDGVLCLNVIMVEHELTYDRF